MSVYELSHLFTGGSELDRSTRQRSGLLLTAVAGDGHDNRLCCVFPCSVCTSFELNAHETILTVADLDEFNCSDLSEDGFESCCHSVADRNTLEGEAGKENPGGMDFVGVEQEPVLARSDDFRQLGGVLHRYPGEPDKKRAFFADLDGGRVKSHGISLVDLSSYDTARQMDI